MLVVCNPVKKLVQSCADLRVVDAASAIPFRNLIKLAAQPFRYVSRRIGDEPQKTSPRSTARAYGTPERACHSMLGRPCNGA